MDRRVRFMLFIVIATGLTFLTAMTSTSLSRLHQISIGTAYAGLIFVAVSLAIGPLRLIRGTASPVSTMLRRDIGIVAGLLALIHTGLGLQVHFGGDIRRYFLTDEPGVSRHLRLDAFGFANHSGLLAALLFLLLLMISNNVSVNRLGGRRWKTLQRCSYAAAALLVFHGVLYAALERRAVILIGVFTLCVGSALVLQAWGAVMWRRRRLV